MLVITGTQRCGTTLMAELMIESGYDVGTMWSDEVGGYEWPPADHFFRGYIGDPTFPFDDFPYPESEAELVHQLQRFHREHQGQLVCKFGYLMMNPVFVLIWHKFRPQDTLLMMRRSPDQVISSKERFPERFDHDSPLLKQDEFYLGYNVQASLGLIRTYYPNKARTLLFPEEMEFWIINNELAHLDPRVQITQKAWDKVYDPDKIHIR